MEPQMAQRGKAATKAVLDFTGGNGGNRGDDF
jgi:hypothetical protein